ncbi:MAG: DUF89 family protein [Bacteroidales bacterium]|nr:DUF89 family protein [Bacteroidales bacterium]
MKTYLDCFPCFMTQALRAARLTTTDETKIKAILDQVGCSIKDMPATATPAENGAKVYEIIRSITGVYDSYKQIKQNSIKEAKQMYSYLKNKILQSDNPLETAIRIAIAGNIIDFGVNIDFNLKQDVEKILFQDFAFFDFENFTNQINKAKTILYIGDNAGESVFDKLLIETINKKTIYAVREIPVINDSVMEDAINSDLDKVATLISSGSKAPGTLLNQCSNEFLEIFNSADIVISKGQGNYEGLSDADRSVFFLLKAKCYIIANHLNVPVGSIILKEHFLSKKYA